MLLVRVCFLIDRRFSVEDVIELSKVIGPKL